MTAKDYIIYEIKCLIAVRQQANPNAIRAAIRECELVVKKRIHSKL